VNLSHVIHWDVQVLEADVEFGWAVRGEVFRCWEHQRVLNEEEHQSQTKINENHYSQR